jgi:nitroimidazol reductase NimA-like FMN-containing flavoprotein (pyridoxamine 5'-phosphate oxidase superfamily)
MAAIGTTGTPSERVRVRRNPKKGRYDEVTIMGILDRALIAHVAFIADGEPVCIPTLCARVDDSLYVHGSQASRTMRALARSDRVRLTATLVQALVLARSAFEHTVNYESVVAFGCFSAVTGDEERLAALQAFTEKPIPGRWAEV